MSPLASVAAGAGLGAVAGSFLAVFAIRWPQGRPVAWTRSRCDGCGRRLRPLELVPLASGLVLGGHCRSCRGRIDRTHVSLEAGCAILGGVAAWLKPGLDGLAGALFLWVLTGLAVIDARHFRLPDALTFSLAALGVGAGAVGIVPPPVERLVGLAVGWAVFAGIAWSYRRARGRVGLGAGDAKLMAAIGAWLGWAALPWVLLVASLGGLGFVGVKRALGSTMRATDKVAFGTWLAIAGGGIWIADAAGVIALP